MYTLSDHIPVRPYRELRISNWTDEATLSEVNILAKIIAIADKYCVSGLVEAAARKMSNVLSGLRVLPPSKEVNKQVSDFLTALYPHNGTPGLVPHQKRLAEIFLKRFDFPTKVTGLDEFIEAHPRFGWDLFEGTCEKLESSRRDGEREAMFYARPASKRKRFGL